MEKMSLKDLGENIVVIGRSNSGKSTLAQKLSDHLKLPVLYMDSIAFYEGSQWENIPKDELAKKVNVFLESHDKWVIEGNYTNCLEARIQKASVVIFMDMSYLGFLWRFWKRTRSGKRIGGLEGAKDTFNWEMLKWVAFNYPKSRAKKLEMIQRHQVPMIHLKTIKQLNACYKMWGLKWD